MKDKQFLQIYESTDYDQFSPSSWNRKISTTNLKKLKESMELYGFNPTNPIQVSTEGLILRGHHRYIAAKQLKIPIYYVTYDHIHAEAIVRQDMAQKAWTSEDAIEFWAVNGDNKEDYQFVVLIKDKYNLRPDLARYICSQSASEGIWSFKFGEISLKNRDSVIKICENYSKVLQVIEKLGVNKKLKFSSKAAWSAFIRLNNNKDFDINRLLRQIENYPMKLKPGFDAESWREMYLEVYNYKRHTRLSDD